ncbi:MAG: hypothetical protein WD768_23480 [Phycisphaeraceae bacterium]
MADLDDEDVVVIPGRPDSEADAEIRRMIAEAKQQPGHKQRVEELKRLIQERSASPVFFRDGQPGS